MTTAREINELVNEALARWAALRGISTSGSKDGLDLHWEDRETVAKINASREEDPSGLTTFMMLRGMAEDDLRRLKFSAYDVVMDPASIESTVAPMRALRAVLEDPRVTRLIDGFQDELRDAALHHGMGQEGLQALEALLRDKLALGFLRHDAVWSMRTLRAHQFTQGAPDEKPVKVNQSVYEFWNVNSLLYAMRIQEVPGVTIALIRDPEEALRSYFAFAIRNGDTITVLTDQDKGPHPAYERMSRRPDRNFSRRAARHWFPYDLVEIQVLDEEREKFVAKARTQLVPINAKAVAMRRVADLKPEQFVWAVLMFDLIRDRYWKRNLLLPELSYTGEMVRVPHALVGKTSDLVRLHGYKPLELQPLRPEDVTAETTAPQWETEPTRFNAWMVERYGHHVPQEVLNTVGPEESRLALRAAGMEETKRDEWAVDKRPRGELEHLEPTNFGTADELQRDRLWAARVNQMKVIRKHAEEEFEAERPKVLKWFRDRIRETAGTFCDAAVTGHFPLPHLHFDGFQSKDTLKVKEALRWGVGDDWKAVGSGYSYGIGSDAAEYMRLGGHRERPFRYTCHDRPGLPASLFAVVEPTCPEALAAMLALPMDQLPWPMRHWYSSEPYSGNSILDRLDPEDWVLKNPWHPHRQRGGVRFAVFIQLSRTAVNERRKRLGLPPMDWKAKVTEE